MARKKVKENSNGFINIGIRMSIQDKADISLLAEDGHRQFSGEMRIAIENHIRSNADRLAAIKAAKENAAA